MFNDFMEDYKSLTQDIEVNKVVNSNIDFQIYKLRFVPSKVSLSNKSQSFFDVAELVIYRFFILFLYMLVALEEADFQVLSTSPKYNSDIESDEWSLSTTVKGII